MDDKYLDFLNCIKTNKAYNFVAKTNDDIKMKTDIVQVVRDTSWIEMIEEMIPYLDNIVRNPRRFIVQEEDIIPIERTKKVTQESIKHLGQHTNLIQDVDKDGTVKPLKLLNIFKEETTDLYENRFVYSLLTNLRVFLDNQLKEKEGLVKSKYIKTVSYNGKTKLQSEIVKINMNISSEFLESSEEVSKNNTIDERIEAIVMVVNDFLSTPFIKSLNGATPVRSPIRKTNVILKDQNFVMAVKLWEFLEKYNVAESIKTVRNSKEEEVGDLSDKFKLAYFLDYYYANNVSEIDKANLEEKFTIPYLKNIIESIVSENNMSEKEFKNLMNKEFKMAKQKKEKLYIHINDIFKENNISHKERIKKSLNYLI